MAETRRPFDPKIGEETGFDLKATFAGAEMVRQRMFRDGLESGNNSPETIERALALDRLKDRSNTPEDDRKYLGVRWVNAAHDQISMGVAACEDELVQASYESIFRELIGPEFGIIFVPEQTNGIVDNDSFE